MVDRYRWPPEEGVQMTMAWAAGPAVEMLHPARAILIDLTSSALPRRARPPNSPRMPPRRRSRSSMLARPDIDGRRSHHIRRRVEGVELLTAIPDLHALGAAEVDLVPALRRPGRVDQGQQFLSGRENIRGVSGGAECGQRLLLKGAACQVSGSAACSSRATSPAVSPASFAATRAALSQLVRRPDQVA